MTYKVQLRRSEEGVSISVPGLPGCWSQGRNEAEAIQNIRDAIEEYLAVVTQMLEDGEFREVEVSA